MKNLSEKENAKRLPISSMARTTLSAGLLLRLGINTSQSLMSDLFSVKRPALKSALISKKNVTATVDTLKNLRGAAMKFGQLLSLDETVILSPDLAAIFAQLQSSGYSMTPSQLKKVLNHNWGDDWLKHFKYFDVRPFAAASIGQVHKATLKSGEVVAIKVQFPGVKQSIDSDLATLKFIMKTSGMLPENFPLEHYLSQCGDLLKRETNYELEAENINLFSVFLKGSKVIHVPKVYNKLSTDQTLTMSFLEGRELSNIMEFDQSARDEISLNLIELLFNEIFNFKMVQTDPNLANFLLTRGGKSICILDFGACCRLSEDTHRLFKELLSVALSLDLNCIKSFLQEKNFIPQETSMAGTKFLENIISVTINELSKDETFDFQKSKVFQLIVQENLNLYFDLIPSSVLGSDFIFIQRKIFGLILFFRSIGTKLPLLKILKHQANLLEL
ncbi:MAG: AarF/ABC1/UbiB kinase family protein [Rhodobacteraceae bacterium]|nr:AarF/ABC1/UbiB kinase family protein [Paracoccaceae bacterium]